MTHTTRGPLAARIASLLACAAATAAIAAPAGGAGAESAQARYKAEKAACMQGRTSQDQQTCLKEARAALGEARNDRLATGATADDRSDNRLARCDSVPERDRQECRLRITQGQRDGSVDAGGVGYELKTRTVGQPTVIVPVAPNAAIVATPTAPPVTTVVSPRRPASAP